MHDGDMPMFFQMMPNEQAHRVAHVREEIATQLGAVTVREFVFEYELARSRASEFDYLLVDECTLEQAAAGYARHTITVWMSDWLAKNGSASIAEKGEYQAQHLEHEAAVLRWLNKLTAIVESEARIKAAVAGVSEARS